MLFSFVILTIIHHESTLSLGVILIWLMYDGERKLYEFDEYDELDFEVDIDEIDF